MKNDLERTHPLEDHERPLAVDERRNPSPLDWCVVAAWLAYIAISAICIIAFS